MQKGSDSGMAHEEKGTLRPIEMVVNTDCCLPRFSVFLSTRSPPCTFMDCHNIRKYSLIRKLSNKLITLLCVCASTYIFVLICIFSSQYMAAAAMFPIACSCSFPKIYFGNTKTHTNFFVNFHLMLLL